MTRALLEAAALAMGYVAGDTFKFHPACGRSMVRQAIGKEWKVWNPLTDDGDCFRMECELRDKMRGPHFGHDWVSYQGSGEHFAEFFADHPDANAARRMAALRAAASLPPKSTGEST
jgi:hypothetical protein